MWRSIKTTAFNLVIFAPVSLWVESKIDFRIAMSPEELPQLPFVFFQLLLMMAIEDFFFFMFHLALHQPLLYKYHKVHHEYTTSTVSLAGLHFHPFEFFLIQGVSSLFNIRLVMLYGPMHISTLSIWFILRILDANLAHSGYNFPWVPVQLLPFCTNDEFHDFHHTRGSGNYASHFRFWDSLLDSNREYRKIKRGQILPNGMDNNQAKGQAVKLD
jgi:sterol desaturase/sphingolipid hydroxylase (fatty acid hydroxylase superfamily)